MSLDLFLDIPSKSCLQFTSWVDSNYISIVVHHYAVDPSIIMNAFKGPILDDKSVLQGRLDFTLHFDITVASTQNQEISEISEIEDLLATMQAIQARVLSSSYL